MNTGPRLILHFDVNKTIFMTDPYKSNSFNIQNELARQYVGIWAKGLPQMTYHHYVTEYKCGPLKGTKDYKNNVIDELGKLISELKIRNHPFYDEARNRHDFYLKKLNSPKNCNIVPSFYSAIDWLNTYKINSYTIILRTYSDDLNPVVEKLQANANLNFMTGEFNEDGHFTLKTSDDRLEFQHTNLSEIYKYWTNIDPQKHIAIKDNYDRWANNKGNWMHSKPYPLERKNKNKISIFFDDNIQTAKGSITNIVAPFDVRTGEHFPVEEILGHFAYPVNFFETMDSKNYFISKIEKTLTDQRTFTPMWILKRPENAPLTISDPSKNDQRKVVGLSKL